MTTANHFRPRFFPATLSIVLVLFAALGTAVPGSRAQNNSKLTESDAEQLLKSLETFEEEMNETKYGRNRGVIAKLTAASASEAKAYDFYLDCVKKVRFTDEGKRQSEFRDWKNRYEKRMRARSNTIALRFQLEYLALTIRAASLEEIDSEIPNLEKFLERMVAAYEAMEGNASKLRDSVLGTVFAQAADLEKSFKPRPGWVKSPLDIDKIYTEVLLPFYRSKKSKPLLASAWSTRIQLLSKIAATWDDKDIAKFKAESLPSLHWKRECELISHGDVPTHINKMWALIKANSTHKDTGDWIETLKSLLTARISGEPLPHIPLEGEEIVGGE